MGRDRPDARVSDTAKQREKRKLANKRKRRTKKRRIEHFPACQSNRKVHRMRERVQFIRNRCSKLFAHDLQKLHFEIGPKNLFKK